MLRINMFSAATSVPGQGVGSAYLELTQLLKDRLSDDFDVRINQWSRADISHYHTVNFSYYLSTFLPGRGVKIGYVHFLPETLEGSLKLPPIAKPIFYHYLIGFYKRMDHLVVVNPTFIPKLEAYGIPRGKITYIPNFVSPAEFHEYTASEKATTRAQYHIEPKKFTILGIGQIQERKGVRDFIKLAKDNPDLQFIWAGGFSFGRITDGYAELKQDVDQPPANLSFPGIVSRDKLIDYYNMADLFLLPSYNELFPMSVLEAFSCGTPVLLRDLDLYRAIIDGYYESAANEAEMQHKINGLRSNQAGLQYLHSQALLAASQYSPEHLAHIWRQFYLAQAGQHS